MKRSLISGLTAGLILLNGIVANSDDVKQVDVKNQEISLGFFNVERGKLEPNYKPGYSEGNLPFIMNYDSRDGGVIPSYRAFVSDTWSAIPLGGIKYADIDRVLKGTKTEFGKYERPHVGIELKDAQGYNLVMKY